MLTATQNPPLASQEPTREPEPPAHPTSYIILVRHTHCAACGTTHSGQELYTKYHPRPQYLHGKLTSNLKRLLPTEELKWNLPIETLHINEPPTPFCSFCRLAAQASLTHLPTPQPPTLTSQAPAWVGALTPDTLYPTPKPTTTPHGSASPHGPASKRPAAPKLTIDNIF